MYNGSSEMGVCMLPELFLRNGYQFHVMAFADDIVIIGRSLKYVEEVFLALEKSGKEMGMVTNEGKTKYMVATGGNSGGKANSIQIENYKFERADKFKYLVSLATNDNNMSKEISNSFLLLLLRTSVHHNNLEGKPEGRITVGRQKLRGLDSLEEDLRQMNIKRSRRKALDRKEWAVILEEAKDLSRPYSQ
ncbi:hypothetical protein ANN_02261 [Periplaneta americana]|uniref:Reverse transcriptase domain-containing protein n=1 Tax=Periplaneta americana TaxID=6978 RepID=A0ABQ8TYX0_PERAM|nr:hypothetical protein ANN_02261 [Periplaneta americana]